MTEPEFRADTSSSPPTKRSLITLPAFWRLFSWPNNPRIVSTAEKNASILFCTVSELSRNGTLTKSVTNWPDDARRLGQEGKCRTRALQASQRGGREGGRETCFAFSSDRSCIAYLTAPYVTSTVTCNPHRQARRNPTSAQKTGSRIIIIDAQGLCRPTWIQSYTTSPSASQSHLIARSPTSKPEIVPGTGRNTTQDLTRRRETGGALETS